MDTKEETGLVILVKLGVPQEVPAVQERKTVTVSGVFCRIPVREDKERVILVTGGSARASYER